jgi:hypothetical protein
VVLRCLHLRPLHSRYAQTAELPARAAKANPQPAGPGRDETSQAGGEAKTVAGAIRPKRKSRAQRRRGSRCRRFRRPPMTSGTRLSRPMPMTSRAAFSAGLSRYSRRSRR